MAFGLGFLRKCFGLPGGVSSEDITRTMVAEQLKLADAVRDNDNALREMTTVYEQIPKKVEELKLRLSHANMPFAELEEKMRAEGRQRRRGRSGTA